MGTTSDNEMIPFGVKINLGFARRRVLVPFKSQNGTLSRRPMIPWQQVIDYYHSRVHIQLWSDL